MKTLLITLLLSISIFGQSGKSVLTQAQKDSVAGMISDSLDNFTSGLDTNTVEGITNPNFVNPTTDQSTWDFHLGSQRAGTDLTSWGITTDYNGVTRTNWTIGAFEYVP